MLCEKLQPRKPENTHLTSRILNVIEKFTKQDEGSIGKEKDYERYIPEDRRHVGNKVRILGSTDGKVREGASDFRFFTTVYEAYNNHWTLRTTPDDWWHTIIRTVVPLLLMNI